MEKKTKTIRIEVNLSIGFANGNRKDEIEVDVPVNATEKEIDEACQEEAEQWANNYIDYGYSIIEAKI